MSATAELSRVEILQEISEHLNRVAELRAILPSAIKRFYRFHLRRPNTRLLIYAESREEAEQKLRARLANEYPGGFELHGVCDVIADPQSAALTTFGSSIMTSLVRSDALEFLEDWKANREGRADPPNGKHRPSQLETDIEHFEMRLQAEKLDDGSL